jgi:hypothetical protein
MQQATRSLTRDDMAGKRQVSPCADYKGIQEEYTYTQFQSLFTSCNLEVNGLVHDQVSLHLGSQCPGVNWLGGWVGLTARLEITERRKISYSWMTKQSHDQWMGDRYYINQQLHTSPSPKMNPCKTLHSSIFVSQRNNKHVKKKDSAEERFFSQSTSSL